MKSGVVFALAAALAVSLGAACGDTGDGSIFGNGTTDAGDGSLGTITTQPDGDPGLGMFDAGVIACAPRTCAQLNVNCGPQGDGCGGVVECGTCAAKEVCGAAGPSKCGKPNPGCVPKTCPQLGATCGKQGDGCGEIIDCGGCTAPQICGGGGTPSACGGGGPTDGGGNCTPTKTTCATGECGPIADGCGGLIMCGGCAVPDTCGGGTVASMCGGGNACTPRTCASVGANCGPVGDGCGKLLQCGASCPSPQICGGAGTPSVCGGGGPTADGGNCVPTKTACALGECGPMADGCGGVLNCGGCTTPQTCGGGNTPSVCGGTSGCVPTTCTAANATCGAIGDGCGNVLQCGSSCPAPQICGGGGVPSQCGGGGPAADGGNCTPTKSVCAPGDCGPIADGCGGLLSCGGCVAPTICGGGVGGPGTPSRCGGGTLADGGAVCVAKTCGQLGANCGAVGDGCGGLIASCGACPFGQICGGGGTASVCGPLPGAGIDGGCQGLCLQQQACDGGGTTTITGTVFAPNGVEPLPNAVVFVPNGGPAPNYGVQPFSAGVACTQCGADITGSPLVKAFTAADGKFTLFNVPVGSNIPIVIQLGRWRRLVTIPAVAACANTAVAATLTRLPRNKTEGDIPLTAIATGNVDSLECVMRKIGIDDSEFTIAGGTGRIQMYRANGATAPSWTGASGLIDSLAKLKDFDVVLLPCEGSADYGVVNSAATRTSASTRQQAMIDYANAGGRVYATHYSYTWLANSNTGTDGPIPFSQTGVFNLDQPSTNSIVGDIDVSFPKGLVFAQWLGLVNALILPSDPLAPKIAINVSRHDMTSVIAPAQSWITVDATPATNPSYTGVPQHMTFNTPTTALPAAQCGRVLYSDFHVSNAATTGLNFPYECRAATGITSSTNATPISVRANGHGLTTGNVIQIANHAVNTAANGIWTITRVDNNNFTLNGSTGNGIGAATGIVAPPIAAPGALTAQEKVLEFMLFDLANCVSPDQPPTCTPTTCTALGLKCGPAGDGCTGTLDCGTCVAPLSCGGGGVPSQCGGPACTPTTCPLQNATCGTIGNGCGSSINCGTCAAGQNCGGGGAPNQCGVATCVPRTCTAAGAQCGPAGDGCGNLLDCGPCPTGQTCGGGGVPNMCGAPACTPRTCAVINADCGPIADGCGGLVNCGTCTNPQTCGGGGTPNRCGSPSCTPRNCAAMGISCGPSGDGCTGVLDCGPCPTNCTPRNCQQAGASCGLAADGCGGSLSCGNCTPPQMCGGGGTPNQCGAPTCAARTCLQMGVTCGPSGDGCGGLLDCGPCPSGCTPRTCLEAGATCGKIADNCGGLLDCGPCTNPQTCGGAGTPNKCGGGTN